MSETLSQKGKVSWTDFPGKPVNWDFELRRERFEKNPAQTNSGISFFFAKSRSLASVLQLAIASSSGGTTSTGPLKTRPLLL